MSHILSLLDAQLLLTFSFIVLQVIQVEKSCAVPPHLPSSFFTLVMFLFSCFCSCFFIPVWREWNVRAKMFCLGEVLDGDVYKVSQYQSNSSSIPISGALDSVLNYPMYYGILQAFGLNKDCTSGMNCLSRYITGTSDGVRKLYPDPDLLGTFGMHSHVIIFALVVILLIKRGSSRQPRCIKVFEHDRRQNALLQKCSGDCPLDPRYSHNLLWHRASFQWRLSRHRPCLRRLHWPARSNVAALQYKIPALHLSITCDCCSQALWTCGTRSGAERSLERHKHLRLHPWPHPYCSHKHNLELPGDAPFVFEPFSSQQSCM